MFIVLFEVEPKEREWDRYLELAARLRPKLEAIPGYLENERYASERTEGRVLSLSRWESEKALIRWRVHGEHHGVQEQGRFEVFADYRLRIGEVVADGTGAHLEQTRFDATEVGAAKAATVLEIRARRRRPRHRSPRSSWTRSGTADSTPKARASSSRRGETPPPPSSGSPSNVPARAHGRSASSATTACTSAARRRSTSPRWHPYLARAAMSLTLVCCRVLCRRHVFDGVRCAHVGRCWLPVALLSRSPVVKHNRHPTGPAPTTS